MIVSPRLSLRLITYCAIRLCRLRKLLRQQSYIGAQVACALRGALPAMARLNRGVKSLVHAPNGSERSIAPVCFVRLIPCRCTMSLILIRQLQLRINVELKEDFPIQVDVVVHNVFVFIIEVLVSHVVPR